MPEPVFLTERLPLVFKTAKWLTRLSSQQPIDLSHSIVLVPTSGAGRRLRSQLVQIVGEGQGLVAPLVTTPMGLLSLAAGGRVANRIDTLLAWTRAIADVSATKFPFLLSGFSHHQNCALHIGQSFVALCSFLAEAALTPISPEIARASSQQEERWAELGSLYEKYRECLAGAGLEDANCARIKAASTGALPKSIQRIIVAGVPDLNALSQEFLQNLEAGGVTLDILVDAPNCDKAGFDCWGRPKAEVWLQRSLSLGVDDIIVTADPASEAEVVARLVKASANPGICVADATIIPFHERAMRKLGLASYDPAGKPLASFECATLSRLWLSFCSSEKIDELRVLAEHPVFLRLLGRESHLAPTDALSALDELQTTVLSERLADAVTYLAEKRGGNELARVATLIAATDSLKRRFDVSRSLKQLPAFLRAAYAGVKVIPNSAEAEALAALAGLLQEIRSSPLSRSGIDAQIFSEEMSNSAVYDPHREADRELNGWLETPWLPDSCLVVSGCTEGALPARISAHPFLPDSLRAKLGLQTNAQRFARDTYLLHCLLASREPGAVKLTLCRTGADGEPAKPSRLFFRCPDADLPVRVRKVFGPVVSLSKARPRERTWLLEIPQRPPPATLRVTAFGDYLKCPLRFYLKHVLGMRKFVCPRPEMHALDFGTVLHKTVENFAAEKSIRDSPDPAAIEKFVLSELDSILRERFGRILSLPLRVQRESLRARLRQFARIQARERQEGWQIQGGELRFEKENTLMVGGLPVVGSLDRVDIHETTGERRVLDYKTFAKRKKSAETHFGPTSGEHDFRDTLFEGKPTRWQDLQLPLYRALAEFLWPRDPQPPTVGYFLLPERIEESGIDKFPLETSVFASATAVAEIVASRVQRGIFWPPDNVQYDDYSTIFLGEDPATLLSESSKDFLAGRPSD
ncbi:MAG TPA: PD-(D/E)XK nuclease family protein [Terrimicrobiaceae bacterium]